MYIFVIKLFDLFIERNYASFSITLLLILILTFCSIFGGGTRKGPRARQSRAGKQKSNESM